jgi:hypothetical protein
MRLLNAVEDPDAELLANIERPSGLWQWPTESPIQIFATQTKSSNGHRLSGAVSGSSALLAGYAALLFRRLGKDSVTLTHPGV